MDSEEDSRLAGDANEEFPCRIKNRIDRVGLELPKIEVRFEDLSVEAEAHVGSRAVPTLLNAALNLVENIGAFLHLSPSKKKVHRIISSVSGILKPSRLTLLLGPPASGKTTLLLALAGKLDQKLKVSGRITYCGHELSEFVPQRTCAYISQHDLHTSQLTVREILDFSRSCLGTRLRKELLLELSRREHDASIVPDPEVDAFMREVTTEGQRTNIVIDNLLKVLSLETCGDTNVGDEMIRGISGGEKKRLTTGEMLFGPARGLFMDEISNGLDSSTTFQIIKYFRQLAHIMEETIVISLLQPSPETYELFDDVILLSEGQIVYHGPKENILEFFGNVGFKCPERKGIADFLQEVTSRKDQRQYSCEADQPYSYISVPQFVHFFKSFYVGQKLSDELRNPYDKFKVHLLALAKEKYGVTSWKLFRACLSVEWLLMKRNSFLYIFKISQITVMSLIGVSVFWRSTMHHETVADGEKYYSMFFYSLSNVMFNGMAELAMTVLRLPVFYKQRDSLFYPPWAFGLSYCILKVPLSLAESTIWIILTYYTVGFAPSPRRFFGQLLVLFSIHHVALSIFRFVAVVGRTLVSATSIAYCIMLVMFVLGGFIISKDDIHPWWLWAYWISPLQYGQTAIAINEYFDPRWNTPNNYPAIDASTVGKAVLKSRGILVNEYAYWISIGALIGISFLLNACFVLTLTYLKSTVYFQTATINVDDLKSEGESIQDFRAESSETGSNNEIESTPSQHNRRGMVLPFQHLSLTFDHVNYYVDMPSEMNKHGIKGKHLQLLSDVSGALTPGVLTALVGVSGAGKTTLLDVLAGRKTTGYLEGSINISGYPKNQETFARISGYCEQNDIHSPYITVHESLIYSAWLRLGPEIDPETRQIFVEEILELVELKLLRDALVGLPGKDGLSTEQRKRLTIAVELVANPSIIFMDEPTTGLDARSAAIVMRTVRNTVNTGRTVVCTIHQPSIDIFEAFDELFLMKRGGKVIYAGELGHNSHKLVEYFEAIPGIPKLKEGTNPATWMLDITSPSVEAQLNINFTDIFYVSSLYQRNQEKIKELSEPAPGSKDLSFPTVYAQSFYVQWTACFWKQHWSYWRNTGFNMTRFSMTIIWGVLLGTIFWNKAKTINNQGGLVSLMGCMYVAFIFLGSSNALTVITVVDIERTVLYRERAAGLYSSLAYALAQVSIEIIYDLVQSLIYATILYTMIGFGPGVVKFFWFFFILFMCLVYFSLLGMMVLSLTPNHNIANVVIAFFLNLWNLFTGFVLPRPLIPVWCRWYTWATPTFWSIYGFVVSQLSDKDGLIQIPGEASTTIKEFLVSKLGYKSDLLGYTALAHIGFCIVFFSVFVYSIKSLNFQNR